MPRCRSRMTDGGFQGHLERGASWPPGRKRLQGSGRRREWVGGARTSPSRMRPILSAPAGTSRPARGPLKTREYYFMGWKHREAKRKKRSGESCAKERKESRVNGSSTREVVADDRDPRHVLREPRLPRHPARGQGDGVPQGASDSVVPRVRAQGRRPLQTFSPMGNGAEGSCQARARIDAGRGLETRA